MARQIALLRGINVGGRRKVDMARLRTLAGDLGYADVRTHVQSGNLVCTTGFEPDRFVPKGREIYLRTPEGLHASRLGKALSARRLGTIVTARNFWTVEKLLAMVGERTDDGATAGLASRELKRNHVDMLTGVSRRVYVEAVAVEKATAEPAARGAEPSAPQLPSAVVRPAVPEPREPAFRP